MPLYPVVNDYPDEFKIPPANRINNPGALTLYSSSTGFEKALADTDAERLMDTYAEAIIDQWNPWQVAYEHLPFLAWAQGVNLWESWWDETFKRNWVARQWYLKSIRGKRAGLDEFVAAVGGSVKRCIVPPARAYGTKAMTAEERAAYVARFPQLRIYPYVAREQLPWLCYNGVHWNGTGQLRAWNKNGSFLGPRWKMYPTVQDAGGKYTRTATIYEPRTGLETKLTIRRIVKINTGPTAAWGYTPGVSQYDESVILPLEKRPAYFIGEPRKYLSFNIYTGIKLKLRTISIGRSGYLDLIQGKAQYQTIFPQEELLNIRPEYVGIPHLRRKTELYACRGEYLIKANSIVAHMGADNLTSGSPVFGRARFGMNAWPIVLHSPVFGSPVLTPASGGLDVATAAWVSNVEAIGGSVSGTLTTGRKNLINNFVLGMRTDNTWNKFDRIWIVAGENQQSARVDIKVGITPAITVGIPTFTPNRGYLCNGTNYLDLRYNPVADGVTFGQYEGHISCWNLDNVANGYPMVSDYPGTNLHIYPKYTDNLAYGRIHEGFSVGHPMADPRGLLLVNRTTFNAQEMFRNGVSIGSNTATAGTMGDRPMVIYYGNCALVTVGAKLTPAEQLSFYNRVRTLLTAIGVP